VYSLVGIWRTFEFVHFIVGIEYVCEKHTPRHFLRLTPIGVFAFSLRDFQCLRRFQISVTQFLQYSTIPFKSTQFPQSCIFSSTSYQIMSALLLTYIMWNPALTERLLIAIIVTGAHLSPKKWKDAASSFYSCSQQFIDISRE